MNSYTNFMLRLIKYCFLLKKLKINIKIRKEQDFVNLEQKFYEQYNNFQGLLKEKDELIETMKILEENNQKLKVLKFKRIFSYIF